MKFNVSYTSVVMVEAEDFDQAVQIVLDGAFDPADASMPIVLDVEPLDPEEEETPEDSTP